LNAGGHGKNGEVEHLVEAGSEGKEEQMKTLFVAALLLFAVEANASCIHGTLTTPAGKAIEGATVTLRAADGSVVNEGKTDARGFFRVDPRKRGDFEVHIVADGYTPLVLNAKAGTNLGTVKLK
jgi:hypothetical protein